MILTPIICKNDRIILASIPVKFTCANPNKKFMISVLFAFTTPN